MSVTDGMSVTETPAPAVPAVTGATQRVLGNVLSLAGGAIAARAVAFIGTAFVARQLGPEGFGIIGFAAAICGYMSIAVSAGFNDVGAREVARRPQEAAAIAAGVTAVRVLLALGALALTIGVALLLPKPPLVRLVVALTGLSFLALALDTSWVYKGLERTRRVGVAQVLAQAMFVVTVLLLVRQPGHVVVVPVAQFAGELAAAALLGAPLLALARSGRVGIHLAEGIRILRVSAFWALSRLLRTLIYTFDVILLGVMLGEWEVGLYAAAYRFCFLVLAISHATHNAYIAVFARAAREGRAALEDVATRSSHLSLAMALPLVVGGVIVAAPLLILLFGVEYAGGTRAFQILLISIGVVFVNGTLHNLLLVHERMRQETLIIAVAAVVNVAANLVLIPSHGILGAAVATVMAETIIVVLGFGVVLRTGLRPALTPLARPVLAVLVMALVLLGLQLQDRLFVAAAVGAATYVGALLVLRGVPADIAQHRARRVPPVATPAAK